MNNISFIILTYNEGHHIARAIASVREIAKEVFVIDSGSTDQTVEIAKREGAQVLTNPFINHAQQFQWALDNVPIAGEWICRLDADEIFEADLIANLKEKLPNLPPVFTGVNLDRKHIFLGRWIKHGGRYPLTLLRIWRKNCARIENRWMDEHIVLLKGSTIKIDGGFADVNLGDLGYFTDKHNKYATREAVDVLNQRYSLFASDEHLKENETGQAKRKRKIKEGFYNKLPFGFGPLMYFLYRYILQFGFLDGVEGAIYHVLQGFWYRFLVDSKVKEFDLQIKNLNNIDKIEKLRALTKLKI